jgi:hypothetical protein
LHLHVITKNQNPIPKLLREEIRLGEEAEIEIEEGQIVLDHLRTLDKVRLNVIETTWPDNNVR